MSETFGQSLRRYRRSGGWSQQRLAQRARLSRSDVSRYESGRQRPDCSTVDVLDGIVGAGDELCAQLGTAPRRDPAADARADDETAALELARRVGACDVGAATLDQLDAAFDDLATAYPASDPRDLLPRLRGNLDYVSTLLDAPRKTRWRAPATGAVSSTPTTSR